MYLSVVFEIDRLEEFERDLACVLSRHPGSPECLPGTAWRIRAQAHGDEIQRLHLLEQALAKDCPRTAKRIAQAIEVSPGQSMAEFFPIP